MQVVVRRGLPAQTKESARRGASQSAICFYCLAVYHMFLLFGCGPYVSIVWRSTIWFYCVALDHMFLLLAVDHMFLLCGARPYVSIVWVKNMFLFLASKPYVFIGLSHPSTSQGRNLLALHK